MTQCSGCGDCCRHIWTSYSLEYLAGEYSAWWRWAANFPDSVVEMMVFNQGAPVYGWRRRRDICLGNASRVPEVWREVTRRKCSDGSVDYEYVCRVLDEKTSKCTAYADRPPVCADYPYYGQKTLEGAKLPPRCSFNADTRTNLPIVEVRHG